MAQAATDNFVKDFEKDRTLPASMQGKFIAAGILPADVDTADARVRAIIAKCQQVHSPSKR